jgi:hypothetical protein
VLEAAHGIAAPSGPINAFRLVGMRFRSAPVGLTLARSGTAAGRF